MKKLLILLLSIIAGYCYGQQSIKASNDTLYFEGIQYYVPRCDLTITYYNLSGEIVDISKSEDGTYLREYTGTEFKLIEFYYKSEKRKKQTKHFKFGKDKSQV